MLLLQSHMCRGSPYFTRKRSRYFAEDEAAAPVQPIPAEDPGMAVGAPCPRCGEGRFVRRDGRYGPFLGCTRFPKCRNTHPLPNEGGPSPSTPRRRRGSGPCVRLEMETGESFRIWSTEAPEQQLALRASLARAAGSTEHELDTAAARADWAPAAARERVSAVHPLSEHDRLLSELELQQRTPRKDGDAPVSPASPSKAPKNALVVQPVPASTLDFFRALPDSASETDADVARAAALMARVPSRLRNTLLGFQRRGVETLLRWGGRGLLADEMGLGKTLQAIAVLGALQPWPALLIVPASLRLMWAEELEVWLSELVAPSDIRLIASSSDALHQDEPTPKLTLTSFRLATTLRAQLGQRAWRAIVVDESHALCSKARAADAQQTEAIAALADGVPHILLLSGTPSLSRPFCLWRQVHILRPGLLGKDKWQFGREYCGNIRVGGIGKSAPLGGGQRDWELHLLLRRAVMVRRRKVDVLSELPPKRRRWLRLPLIGSDVPPSADEADEGGDAAEESSASEAGDGSDGGNGDEVAEAAEGANVVSHDKVSMPHHQTAYEAAGLAKLHAARRFIIETLHSLQATEVNEASEMVGPNEAVAAGGKLVVFAHHKRVLDGLQAALHSRGPLVRIDGSTPLPQRHLAIKRFNKEPHLRLALVSVTAASLGIDLSAASTVIFAELPPDAAWLAQAEDRCHRKGQRDAVSVTILLAHAAPRDDDSVFLPICSNRLAAQLDACRFDARHAAALKQSERVVRRVTDGPGTRSSGASSTPSETSSFIDATLPPPPPASAGAAAALAELAISFECSRATGRLHAFLGDSSDANSMPSSMADPWWTYHTSYAAEELPCIPTGGARELAEHVAMSRSADDDALRRELAQPVAVFLALWNSLSAHCRRRLRGGPLHAAQLLPLLEQATAETVASGAADGAITAMPELTADLGAAEASPRKSPSTRRERPRLEAEEEAPAGTIWGVAHVPQRFRSSSAMPMAVSADGGGVLCLSCYAPLKRPPTGFMPGPNAPEAKPLNDTELFCGGSCRADYFARRCSGSLRRQLGALDGAVCAACGLDAAAVCQALCEAPPGAARSALLLRLAPAIAANARLAARLLDAPHLSGHCWHADHVLAVADGGGECTVANMQVLCVACHLAKSGREGRQRRERRGSQKGVTVGSSYFKS